MPGRTIAIGDIHGCLAALDALLTAISPGPEDTLVTLGDYIDRGPQNRGSSIGSSLSPAIASWSHSWGTTKSCCSTL
jgi:hypothetical protein